MLEFRNVSKKYPDGNIALDNIDFTMDDGEFLFFVGASGAGKSTILRLLLNIEKPSSGEIIFNNVNVNKIKGNKLAYLRRQIGVVFQDYKLLQQKTVYENVAFVLEVAREKKINIHKKVNDVLDLVGLLDKAKKFPAELSGGEQQRVAIARSIVNDPLLLIADEPTGSLDSDNAWDTFQLLNKINNWGTSVVVVTHDNEIVDSLQRRVVRLENGRIIRDSIGGYTENLSLKEKADRYINHPDRFPDKGENEKHYKKRKKIISSIPSLPSKRAETELEEIYSNFEEKKERVLEEREKIEHKLQKKKGHEHLSERSDVDDNE